ncbi:MAG: 16S rRNA (cytosine(1402)-N(4))-methyltransferase RsmH [Bacteroidetes bacterium]|nr:16S rRNA (cytosine(1402)-N(4))-methyltransferase RsmH [Bacteroidota bacterium]
MSYHQPVLLSESIEGLNIVTGGVYVDVTFGGGGHSKEIVKRLSTGKLIAFDQDADAKANALPDKNFVLIHSNFSMLLQYLRFYSALPADGILADLGVSSYQFDTATRGFSIRFDGPLDMRMDKQTKQTAAHVLKTYNEQQLQQMFSQNGEVINSKTLAKCITAWRTNAFVDSIFAFKEAIASCVRGANPNDYYAQVFQALRIEVNDEMGALKKFLQQSIEALKPGGRLVVISYHSLEDRMVKNIMKCGNVEGNVIKDFFGNAEQSPFRIISKKPIVPTSEEIKSNSRARSAKLRIAEKK